MSNNNFTQEPKRKRIVIRDDDDYENEEQEAFNPVSIRHQRRRNDDDSYDSNPDKDNDSDPEDEEGEDLNENWIDDYAPAPELDQYDADMLARDDDDELYESYEKRVRDRLAAEEELDALEFKRKQRELQQENNLERLTFFEQQEIDEDEDEDEELVEGADKALNLEAFDIPLREWIAEERTRKEIHRRLKRFLQTFYVGIDEVTRWERKHEGLNPKPPLPSHLKISPPVYPAKIRNMCATNSSSIEVSYGHLGEMQSLLAIWLTDVPRDMLQIFDEVLQTVVLEKFPHYAKIVQEVHVRIINLPISDRLRNLRQTDLNNLIRVSGVITRRSVVFPQIKSIAYDCVSCGHTLGPFTMDFVPDKCPNCMVGRTLRTNQQKTVYGNFQRITLQETPGTVPPGRVPRHKDVILVGDLIDIARPGEEIEVTGIYVHTQQYSLKEKTGFPVYTTCIEANCIQKKQGTLNTLLSEDDKRRIIELSNDPQIRERIIRTIAPSIYGHRHVKTAVALSLFGGCAKGGSGGMHRVRGDINVLLLGDPGTAKSQILKYAEKTAPRSVYTTGKGASAVGLTAGVHRDPQTKEWTLEGGALVLADQGVCLIDEFDKMNEQDRTSIHEAMEQQTISVSKAGIVTSLQARCAVIAAANPISGRYDPSYNLGENVELTDPILQRFDVLCVLQDIVDPLVDERLANFVVGSHMKSHPEYDPNDEQSDDGEETADNNNLVQNDNNSYNDYDGNTTSMEHKANTDKMKMMHDNDELQPLTQSMLKKYITYARAYTKPVLHDVDSEKIAMLYSELRRQSAISGGVPIAVRHIESVMRMAEASAKMHLREHVREDDVDLAIKVMLESFLQAQKVAVRKGLQKNFKKYITYGEESNQLLMHQLQTLLVSAEKFKIARNNRSNTTEVFIYDLENRAKELNIFDLRPFFKSNTFKNHHLHVEEERGVIVKTYMVI
eukprot:gene5040-7031_t